jgi:hypothetical protein
MECRSGEGLKMMLGWTGTWLRGVAVAVAVAVAVDAGMPVDAVVSLAGFWVRVDWKTSSASFVLFFAFL